MSKLEHPIRFQVFRRLKRQTKLRYCETPTLTERYQLKEIETVLAALTPIIKAFILQAFLVNDLFMSVAYLHFVRDEPLGSPLTQALFDVRVKNFLACFDFKPWFAECIHHCGHLQSVRDR